MRRNTKQHPCFKKICAAMLKSLLIGWNTSLPESLCLDFSRKTLPTHQSTLRDKQHCHSTNFLCTRTQCITRSNSSYEVPYHETYPQETQPFLCASRMVKHAPAKICPCLRLKLPPLHLHFPTRKKKKKVVKKIKMETYLEGAVVLWLVHWTLGREV